MRHALSHAMPMESRAANCFFFIFIFVLFRREIGTKVMISVRRSEFNYMHLAFIHRVEFSAKRMNVSSLHTNGTQPERKTAKEWKSGREFVNGKAMPYDVPVRPHKMSMLNHDEFLNWNAITYTIRIAMKLFYLFLARLSHFIRDRDRDMAEHHRRAFT